LHKKILITGASGFIGTNLKTFLKSKKAKFKTIKTRSILKKRKKYFKDISHLIHLGFDFKKEKKIKKTDKNVLYIKRIIQLSKFYKFKIIFPSTCSYKYRKSDKRVISKKIYPLDNYSLSKINCENCLYKSYKKIKNDVTVLRIFNVYGPHQNRGWLIPDLIYRINSIKPDFIKLKYFNNTRDFIYIDDVCLAIYKSLRLAGFNILNIGTGKDTKILKVAKLVLLLLKLKKKIILLEKNSKKNSISKAHIKKTIKLLEWKPKIKLFTGLKNTIKYEKKKF